MYRTVEEVAEAEKHHRDAVNWMWAVGRRMCILRRMERCLAGPTGVCGAKPAKTWEFGACLLRSCVCIMMMVVRMRHLIGMLLPSTIRGLSVRAMTKLILDADMLLSLLIPSVILVHLFLAPYTKVEESFNIQATHDILTHGLPWGVEWEHTGLWLREHYDHLTYTGSVPRTLVGPLALAGVSWPILRFGPGGVGSGELGRQLVGESRV